MQAAKPKTRCAGAALCAAATAAFSVGGLCVELSGAISPLALHGGRCAVAAIMTGIVCLMRAHKLRFNYAVVTGALSLCLTGVFYIFSARLSTAANAIILQYTSPAFAALFLWLFFSRTPSRAKLCCVGIVFAGTLLCCGTEAAAGNIWGSVFGLCSGVTFAGVFLAGTLPGADALSACLLGEVLSAVLGLPFLFTEGVSGTAALCVLLMGVVQTGGAYLLLGAGMARTDALTANLICASEPVLNVLWVALLCSEIPEKRTLLGGVLVLCGVILSYFVQDFRPSHKACG